MKLVIDTNILISSALWHGPPARLVSAALSGRAQIFLSLSMLLELQEALQYPRFGERLKAEGENPTSIMNRFRAACHEASPARLLPPHNLRDPDDFHILACAVGAAADAIVTGDKDLLALKSFNGIEMLTVGQVLLKLGL